LKVFENLVDYRYCRDVNESSILLIRLIFLEFFMIPHLEAPMHVQHSIALGLTLALAATAAVAAPAPTPTTKIIIACYNKETGRARIVDSVKDCRHDEDSLVWNAEGPAGPAGPQGPQGPMGMTGP
jgi:hypothetical protein